MFAAVTALPIFESFEGAGGSSKGAKNEVPNAPNGVPVPLPAPREYSNNTSFASFGHDPTRTSDIDVDDVELLPFFKDKPKVALPEAMAKTLSLGKKVNTELEGWTEPGGYRLYHPIQDDIAQFVGNATELAAGLKESEVGSNTNDLVQAYKLFTGFFNAMNPKVTPIFNVGGDYETDLLILKLDKAIAKMTNAVLKAGRKDSALLSTFTPLLAPLSSSYSKTIKLTKITGAPTLPTA